MKRKDRQTTGAAGEDAGAAAHKARKPTVSLALPVHDEDGDAAEADEGGAADAAQQREQPVFNKARRSRQFRGRTARGEDASS